MLQGLKFDTTNLKSIECEENYYKFCEFKNLSIEGGHVDSDFTDCKFVECEIIDSNFIKDDLNGECDFKGSVTCGCDIKNTTGFKISE